jgi:hypothetical protein
MGICSGQHFLSKEVWTLPQEYVCPGQQCRVEEEGKAKVYHLCEPCQERFMHFTSWLSIALRMIAGDFQEQVELQEPEEVVAPGVKRVKDEQTGEVKTISAVRRYRVIRYLDTCVRKGSHLPQTRRGSWMSGRPLAESEYEVNPNAIIYVQSTLVNMTEPIVMSAMFICEARHSIFSLARVCSQ